MADSPSMFDTLRQHAGLLMTSVPWANELGFEVTDIEPSRARARATWREDLVGDPETGVIAGGVITALLDNLCGIAVAASLTKFRTMATLDLRIDYMRPATKGEDILAEAECYHLTKSVAFCRATAFHGDSDRLIASATAAFALNTSKRRTERSSKPVKAAGSEGTS